MLTLMLMQHGHSVIFITFRLHYISALTDPNASFREAGIAVYSIFSGREHTVDYT